MSTETNPQSLMRLMTWLSPVFPTGGFSYSHGLEAAIANALVTDREELKDWLGALISGGSIRNDCVLLSLTCRTEGERGIREYAEIAAALAGSKERYLESMNQGKAFMEAARPWLVLESFACPLPLPVALGCAARDSAIAPLTACIAFLQSFTSNQIQAALRLMPLGQQNGVWIQRKLEPRILESAKWAASATPDDLGSNTFLAEISSMQHETLQPRIFMT